MELTYTLDENDFLNHQLYLASKSDRIKKSRLKRRIWAVVAFLSMAWLFYMKRDVALFWYFFVAAALAAIFYPLYLRRLYKRHYQKYIRENYLNRIGKTVAIQLDDEKLWSKNELSEGSISLAGLTEIVEVPTAFYLKTDTSSALLLPKSQMADTAEVKAELQAVARRYSIPYQEELNWQWK
ncbi:YcxB family protein [Hymenobacter cheonanensis]|uniref:YcxB family protein n=1 Tax=Hymenobacter sp. CA2-7 TaxID=3063993 RepID=UPI0027134E8A|nr:YcxB family protein [Hymenobacter sp. CA2-7]MDO7886771.1 YcxB family protein [Hymenobacter sp. CA2-7]